MRRAHASDSFLKFFFGGEGRDGGGGQGFSGKNRGENLIKFQAGLCCERYRTISFSFAPPNP
jgi:hypothetical protein